MEPKRFSDQIRDAVNASEMSRYAICNAIGMTQGTMSRFMSGKAGMSLTALDKLAELLGLAIVARSKATKRKESSSWPV